MKSLIPTIRYLCAFAAALFHYDNCNKLRVTLLLFNVLKVRDWSTVQRHTGHEYLETVGRPVVDATTLGTENITGN